MVPPLPRDPCVAEGLILVGPGPRSRELALLLSGLAAARGVETRVFGDVAELSLERGRAALLLLDADATPVEDAGYVRRFLTAHPEVELLAFGADPRARTVRVLDAWRFCAWPPDVDELAAWVQSAKRSTRIGSSPPSIPPTSVAPHARVTAGSDELDEVRSILDGDDRLPATNPTARATRDGSGSARPTHTMSAPLFVPPTAPAHLHEPAHPGSRSTTPVAERGTSAARADFQAAFPEDFEPSATRAAAYEAPFSRPADSTDANAYHVQDDDPRDAPSSRFGARTRELDLQRDADEPGDAPAPRPAIDAPPWWRAQVADLADAAQRIDLSVKMLVQAAPDIDEGQAGEAQVRLRELEAEVARLLQFTRTLGYVAAPPAAGSQTFDLGEIVHVFAANLAQSGPDAPRCQFKTASGSVRSDRQLVSQTLDALFFLVRCTSRKGDLVRAQVQSTDDARGAGVELTIDFPSGPLEGFGADDVITPYGLADLFPELGPNALAAAAGIVAGQGGSLGLVNRARSRMTWTLWMPRAG